MIFMVLFGSFDDNKSYAIEPLTAGAIAFACSTLALSLGFGFVDSQSDNFTQGVMKLYSNFSTNVKNIVDRIARKKMEGSPTFDITPDELQAFGNDLSNLISDGSSSGGVTTISFPTYKFTQSNDSYESSLIEHKNMALDTLWHNYGLNRNTDYLNYRIYYDGNLLHDHGYMRFDFGSKKLDWWRIYDNQLGEVNSSSSKTPSYNVPQMYYYENNGDFYYMC